MIISSIFILCLYGLLLLWVYLGVRKLPKYGPIQLKTQPEFSVLVVFRNESKNIPDLVQSLIQLSYPHAGFELIFIDDQSTDKGAALLHSALQNSSINYLVHPNNRVSNSPKKDAITLGISLAKNPWIITLDADCRVPESWLNSYAYAIESYSPELIIGPVQLQVPSLTMLHLWQAMEHLALQQITRGCAGHNKPTLANGANLCYTKALFLELNGFNGNSHIASGDDQFLLEKANLAHKKIVFLNQIQSAVTTKAETSWKGAIHQRVRWATKSTHSKSIILKGLGIGIGLCNLWMLVVLIYLLINPKMWLIFVLYIVFKTILDFMFLTNKKELAHATSPLDNLLATLVYPFVLLRITLKAVKGGYRWKQRSFKK